MITVHAIDRDVINSPVTVTDVINSPVTDPQASDPGTTDQKCESEHREC